jgi:hypothetical protein
MWAIPKELRVFPIARSFFSRSKGDMRGACKSYMRAQKMGATKG